MDPDGASLLCKVGHFDYQGDRLIHSDLFYEGYRQTSR